MKTRCTVYILRDPDTTEIRYVGQTRLTMMGRMKWHKRKMKEALFGRVGFTPLYRWMEKLDRLGKEPIAEEITHNGAWDKTEMAMIERLRLRGDPLLNVDGLADGLFTPPQTLNSQAPKPAKEPVAAIPKTLDANGRLWLKRNYTRGRYR